MFKSWPHDGDLTQDMLLCGAEVKDLHTNLFTKADEVWLRVNDYVFRDALLGKNSEK